MKKLLFVIPSLSAGGGEKSLINLLSVIDYTQYEVDLLLFHKRGLFIPLLPKQVNVITIEDDFSDFSKPLLSSILVFFKKGKIKLALQRVLFFLKNKSETNTSKAEQISWSNISHAIPMLNKEYNAAIGSLEKSSIYYVVDKVIAKTKIGWIHTNYSKSGMNQDFDYNFFHKLDALVTVSEECKVDLEENFPKIKNKVKLIYNVVSPSLIHKLSDNNFEEDRFDSSGITLVTVARLSKEKGIDLALQTSIELVKSGLNFKWYIIGDGVERSELELKIKEHKLESVFILLGLKDNPYPFIKKATLYVQPSQYEGKSIAIDEAKILAKPIIVTNYPTAKDQINDGENGVIVAMDPVVMALKISALLNDAELLKKIILNLERENLGTEEEIFKLYNIINSEK